MRNASWRGATTGWRHIAGRRGGAQHGPVMTQPRRPNLTRPRGPDILPADVCEAAQDGRLAELVPAEIRRALESERGNLSQLRFCLNGRAERRAHFA